MEYRYAPDGNYEDLAAGRVLVHRPGNANFPVRLASEIFLRAASYLPEKSTLAIYDPCCGGGYLLAALGFLHPERIGGLAGSDVSRDALATAEKNLSLLTPAGMAERIEELERLLDAYQKPSHREALLSAERLLARIGPSPLTARLFQADAQNAEQIERARVRADVVIADVPYGDLTEWSGPEFDALDALLVSMRRAISAPGVIAICSDKRQKIRSAPLRRLEKQMIGKRKFELYIVE